MGSCLAALTAFHLMRSRPIHRLAGLVFPFGEFDLTLRLPQETSFTRPLLVNIEALQRFNDAYLPGMSIAKRRSALVSPLYVDMQS